MRIYDVEIIISIA